MSASLRARLALAAGIVCGMAALGAGFAALYWLLSPARFPVAAVEIKGSLRNTSEAALRAALPGAPGNFFAVDLAEVRAGLERLPWVRRVAVRRVWPAGLEITVEEHVALARWGDEALVNTQGERFVARTSEALPSPRPR
jgi:cell division protein FtsQ